MRKGSLPTPLPGRFLTTWVVSTSWSCTITSRLCTGGTSRTVFRAVRLYPSLLIRLQAKTPDTSRPPLTVVGGKCFARTENEVVREIAQHNKKLGKVGGDACGREGWGCAAEMTGACLADREATAACPYQGGELERLSSPANVSKRQSEGREFVATLKVDARPFVAALTTGVPGDRCSSRGW